LPAIQSLATAEHVSVTNGAVVAKNGKRIVLNGPVSLVEGVRVHSRVLDAVIVGPSSLVQSNDISETFGG